MKKAGALFATAVGVATFAVLAVYWPQSAAEVVRIPYDRAEMVTMGQAVYEGHCASCHGLNFEGEPNWRQRDPNGLLPAPPHDATGHTWHHPDQMLFELTKYGVQRFVGSDYQSKMPAFEGVLDDREIWATLAYIKSSWPEAIIERHNSAFSAP